MANKKLEVKKYNSYAKINLFLHVFQKRKDGLHDLQTWFMFINLKDNIEFRFNDSKNINILSNIKFSQKKDNLIYKAIKIFENEFNIKNIGVDIYIKKNIPIGAGLGGGSSNAATTLKALRDYFLPELSNNNMLTLSKKIGADVPIFIYGKSAWAEGIGNVFYQKKFIRKTYILLVKPNISISTKEFFESQFLIKNNNKLSKNLEFNINIMHNDFEKIFYKKYPNFVIYLKKLDKNFRMTGTGSCFYLLSENENKLLQLSRKLDKYLDKWILKTLNYI